MRTIYNYNYNYTNLFTLLLIFFLLVIFIAIVYLFSPLIKLSYGLVKALISRTLEVRFPDITKKETVITVIFSFVLHVFLSAIIIIFSVFLFNSKFDWIDTNISTCNVISGTCENFSYQKFESRDYIEYTCNFTVKNVNFSEVEIRQSDKDVIKYLTEDYNFEIYYREIKGKNRIVRINAFIENEKTGDGSVS